jgi:TPP-dependent pyruvate/acetoin dehydrogenase alpha subunit
MNNKNMNIEFNKLNMGKSLWKRAYRIRQVEEEIAKRYLQGKMRCPTHLSVGQEGVPSALAEYLTNEDYAVSTHRGHAHYLAKGGNLNKMIAELHGKVTGCCGGRGGSMHLSDVDVGFMGTTAIVGNSIPLGVGLALSAQIKNTQQIACIYLGDGATEEGVFYESINFAAVRRLPVLFICENNFFSVYSDLTFRQPKNRKIFEMVSAMGVKSSMSDGNDMLAACNLLGKVVSEVRSGVGPYFLEFATYRWREHCGPNYDDDLGYRSDAEIDFWKKRDPVAILEGILKNEFSEFEREALAYKIEVEKEIEEAFEFADRSPFPLPESLDFGVYHNE